MSQLLKIAKKNKQINKSEYKWHYPLSRPPRPRNINELETLSKGTTLHGIGGALAGAGLGIAYGYLSGPGFIGKNVTHRETSSGNKIPISPGQKSNINSAIIANSLKTGLIGGATGFTAGASIGQYRTNKKVLKDRLRNNDPVYTKEEEERLINSYKPKSIIPSFGLGYDQYHNDH